MADDKKPLFTPKELDMFMAVRDSHYWNFGLLPIHVDGTPTNVIVAIEGTPDAPTIRVLYIRPTDKMTITGPDGQPFESAPEKRDDQQKPWMVPGPSRPQ